MKVLFHRKNASWQGRLLCVTHSDRPVHTDGCGLNDLETRFAAKDRLPPKLRFDELEPAAKYSPYLGSITIWRLSDDLRHDHELLAHLHPETYKPQHAIIHDSRIWVLGTETLESYDLNWQRVAVINDSWLAGGHTVFPVSKSQLLLSCSASDAILSVDLGSQSIDRTWRLPAEIYGTNFSLHREDSVVDHFIYNDLQLTHVNCAVPYEDGILVSTLIQGAIGKFDGTGKYEELARGFVGCHGIRTLNAEQFYFCDSCLGTINYLDRAGRLSHRIACDSVWLHDAQHLDERFVAICPADRNSVEILNTFTRETVSVIACGHFGASTQFLSLTTL